MPADGTKYLIYHNFKIILNFFSCRHCPLLLASLSFISPPFVDLQSFLMLLAYIL